MAFLAMLLPLEFGVDISCDRYVNLIVLSIIYTFFPLLMLIESIYNGSLTHGYQFLEAIKIPEFYCVVMIVVDIFNIVSWHISHVDCNEKNSSNVVILMML